MIMVVFGAGASYDSNPYHPAAFNDVEFKEFRMPLANELASDRKMFNEKLALFPDCHPIIPLLINKTNIEAILQHLQDESKTDPVRHQQLAAFRFYLSEVIWECETTWVSKANGIMNHLTLLDHLRHHEKEGICLVTFNYDRLIETALKSRHVNIQSLPDYIVYENYRLIKLHGSVDWAHVVNPDELPYKSHRTSLTPQQMLINNASDIKFSEDYQILTAPSVWSTKKNIVERTSSGSQNSHSKEVWLFPAIAIPAQRKTKFECPQEHVSCLKSLIPQVDKLLVIGWRATEQPFLELLSANLNKNSRLSQCLVVSESIESAKTTIDNLSAHIQAKYDKFTEGFTSFINSQDVLDSFLRV